MLSRNAHDLCQKAMLRPHMLVSVCEWCVGGMMYERGLGKERHKDTRPPR